ncbi:translation initiation factor 3 subunit K, partial [Tremellales sp. Uapishka_1]
MPDLSQAVPEKSLAQWHTPESRTDVIQELIHGVGKSRLEFLLEVKGLELTICRDANVDRYNPTNLSFMEEYLYSQVKNGEYDILANLAILKLYQFNPTLSNPDVIVHILIKSLISTVHGPDFNLCKSLLREPAAILQDIESEDDTLTLVMPLLSQLHDHVRACQFTAFWTEFNSQSEAVSALHPFFSEHTDLLTTLRHLFSTSIASTFSSITLARLSRWLNLSSSEVGEWCKSIGWSVEGDLAQIPKNGDNDVKAGVVKENVELSQLTKLVAAAAY